MTSRNPQISRRRFLGSASLATTAALIRGPQSHAQASETIRLALIGAGAEGFQLAKAITAVRGVRLAAVVEVDTKRLDAAVKLAEGGRPFTDLRRCLEEKDIDGVVITTCTHWNALAGIWSLLAGKDIYVETPASHTLRMHDLLFKTAAKTGRVVQVGNPMLSHPLVTLLREHIKHVGAVHTLSLVVDPAHVSLPPRRVDPVPETVNYDQWVGPAPLTPFDANRFHYNWRWLWAYGNGFLGDEALRLLDLAFSCLPRLDFRKVTVSSSGLQVSGEASGIDTPDTQLVTYRLDDVLNVDCEIRAWRPAEKNVHPFHLQFGGTLGVLTVNETGVSRKDMSGKIVWKQLHPEGWPIDRFLDRRGQIAEFSSRMRERPREENPRHLATMLCHLGNAAFRARKDLEAPRQLVFDASKRLFTHPAANALLSEPQRPPFVVTQAQ